MAQQCFFRLSVVRIPFTATSAGIEFDMMGKIPTSDGKIIDDLTFMFVNQTPYDVRLEGSPVGGSFNQVTASSGWPISARTAAFGPFTSKKPAKVSVQAFSTPGVPLTGSEDFTGCFIEIIYGRGAL